MIYTAIVGDQVVEIEIGQGGEMKVDGVPHCVDLRCIDGFSLFSLIIDNRSHEVLVERQEGDYQVLLAGEMHKVRVEDERTRALAKVKRPQKALKGEMVVRAPMPGLVVAVPVKLGDSVRAGQGVVILEAMKMENELRAPRNGVVQSVRVSQGDAVEQGQSLLVIA